MYLCEKKYFHTCIYVFYNLPIYKYSIHIIKKIDLGK